MTLKEVEDIVITPYLREHGEENMSRLLKKLRDKQFWIWSRQEHEVRIRRHPGLCCFNLNLMCCHIVGWSRS